MKLIVVRSKGAEALEKMTTEAYHTFCRNALNAKICFPSGSLRDPVDASAMQAVRKSLRLLKLLDEPSVASVNNALLFVRLMECGKKLSDLDQESLAYGLDGQERGFDVEFYPDDRKLRRLLQDLSLMLPQP